MPENKAGDLRIQRTHTLLLVALTDLLHEKTFDEIRVKDICEKANIHRSTFYAHFEDKRHLLTFGFQELIDVLTSNMPSSAYPIPFQQAVYQFFDYFLRREKEYSKLFLDPRNAIVKQIFQDELTRILIDRTKSHPFYNSHHRDEITILCQFFAGGLVAVAAWWLQSGTKLSVEEVSSYFSTIYLSHVQTTSLC
ncbi:MAG: TetR/AcrR family transcriptional regulator [Evtepia sp.]|uniref:TetR/AcrR family transcriptional regulator n=1 Tax=Evtepia sp. TaxID=2773933 RepID=UPI002A756EBE|nr:TetR/AcrR family transcriptional regulator [Evtepia sp.]MDY3015247.1 TetR/AcrR family transcriptional regulator [Evtepia sp.]